MRSLAILLLMSGSLGCQLGGYWESPAAVPTSVVFESDARQNLDRFSGSWCNWDGKEAFSVDPMRRTVTLSWYPLRSDSLVAASFEGGELELALRGEQEDTVVRILAWRLESELVITGPDKRFACMTPVLERSRLRCALRRTKLAKWHNQLFNWGTI